MQKTMNTRKEATGQDGAQTEYQQYVQAGEAGLLGDGPTTFAEWKRRKLVRSIKQADRITECERLGREAHGRGLTAEASTDDRLMALVNARANCTTLDQEPDIVDVFRAWIRGWHAAEQAARLSAAGQEV